jgi:gliding motility-associated-like protein
MILDPGSQYISYLWQDNSTLPFYTATSAGTYTVLVENNYGCFGEDELYLNISTSQVNLGEDRQICEGETEILDAGEGFVSYLWQDNTTEQTYTVSLPGTYSVTITDDYGCESSDDVIYSYYPYPNPNLGPDQIICEGETTILQAPEGEYIYYWNGIAGEQTYEVSTAGQYLLSMVNPCDSVSDDIEVSVEALPEVNLGEDNVLFPGETIELDAGSGYDAYQWQDGSGGQYFMVTENNINTSDPYYYVEVTEGTCKNSDTIMIELYQIWVPKVITPNGDGDNDMFRADPESWSGVNQHTMQVFNRWGEKVWETTDFETGWDGKQNGKNVSEGTYFWILEVYYGNDNAKQVLKGSLTVLGSSM